MRIAVTFKNVKSSNRLKSYVQEKLDKFDRLLDTPGTADVVIRSEKLRNIVEIHLSADRLDIHVREEHPDNHYAAVDVLVDTVRNQITNAKDKKRSRRTRTNGKSLAHHFLSTESTV